MPAPADYVDVATRIREFYEKYPDGSLQTTRTWMEDVGEKSFIVAQACAYRHPDDKLPGIGTAWEPVPGPTPFTKDSELQNAETSAWGRAIVALGFETKHIASSNEVRNRQAADEATNSPAKPSSEQKDEMKALLLSLDEKMPTQAGQLTWADEAREFAKQTFSKQPHQLNTEEFEVVLADFRRRLKDQDIPFG